MQTFCNLEKRVCFMKKHSISERGCTDRAQNELPRSIEGIQRIFFREKYNADHLSQSTDFSVHLEVVSSRFHCTLPADLRKMRRSHFS